MLFMDVLCNMTIVYRICSMGFSIVVCNVLHHMTLLPCMLLRSKPFWVLIHTLAKPIVSAMSVASFCTC